MSRVGRFSMAAMVATLLLGMLVGVVWARRDDGPQVEEITRKVTLPASVFIPGVQTQTWHNTGSRIYCDTTCYFHAPVVFPCLPSVTVERIKLHAYDKSTGQRVCAKLFRVKPAQKKSQLLGEICTTVAGTTGDPETLISPDINKVIWPSQGAQASLVFGPDINVYGITVEYHRNL